MASNFERWEKDPFFPAAEEVQESADRMESTYRTLIHASKEPSVWNSEALRRDLATTIGTTKWQLEEFERAVICSYDKPSTDDAKDRHRKFIHAIEDQISRVESSWNDSSVSTGKPPRPWVSLDENETQELAQFLSGSTNPSDQKLAKNSFDGKKTTPKCSKKSSKDYKFSGHRRSASVGANIGSWNITVSDDKKLENPPRKIPSFSCLLSTLESASRWPKNGYRKLKLTDQHEEPDTDTDIYTNRVLEPTKGSFSLETRPLITRGIKGSHERSKSCPENCDDFYDKRLHGWSGTVKRRFQRSQNFMLYSRHTQMIFSILVIVLIVIRLI